MTTDTAPFRVAFLGLGAMGYPMAGHLAKAGYNVQVYNRTSAKSLAWIEEFGQPHIALASPREAAQGADVVFCCVGNDDDLKSVVLGDHGALAGMKSGAILVDHTTASANVARQLFEVAQQHGLHFLDAPVSGGQVGAQNGKLSIMCGGMTEAFERASPVMRAYAQTIKLMGAPGAGQLTKMVNQICVAGVLQGLSEALAFGMKAGLDMHLVLEVISKGAAQSWQMEHRGPTMITNQFDFGFAVEWMRKDLSLVLDEARQNGAKLPTTALIDQFYADIQTLGGGRLDTSSLIKRLI